MGSEMCIRDRSYYATASRRNEGRLKLDAVQKRVRLLQNHVLSSSLSSFSSSSSSSSSNDDNAIKQVGSSALLQSILQTPMGEITQTDMRLLSQEINMIMKRIDEARDLVCPKEKFIFKRYRAAMEKAGEEAISADNNVRDGTTSSREGCMSDETIGISPLKDETNSSLDIIRSKFGGVLENLSDCTIEISSDNTTIFITEAMADHGRLQYYTQPRSIHALHPPSSSSHIAHHSKEASESQLATGKESSSSSYLLQNLHNVTLLLHGSRPSLHIQHIDECKIYITEPTLGAVHVTDAQCSTIHCACYQLRVHDSKEVQFNVWTRSGPIIEGCTGMVFMRNYYLENGKAGITDDSGGKSGYLEASSGTDIVVGRNMYWDVKDFNWLRALRKSPNFVVVDTVVGTKEAKIVSDTKNDVISMKNCSEDATMVEVENDSEDEL